MVAELVSPKRLGKYARVAGLFACIQEGGIEGSPTSVPRITHPASNFGRNELLYGVLNTAFALGRAALLHCKLPTKGTENLDVAFTAL